METESQEFSTEPVPEHQTVPWVRVGLISALVAFSLPTFLSGIEIMEVTENKDAMIGFVVGGFILAIVGSIMGAIGARTRLSSYMLTRIAFGTTGAAFVNLALAIALLGWFGVNIDLFGSAILQAAEQMFGYSLKPWVVEIFAGLVMTLTTVYGFQAINKLSLLFVPILMVVTGLLLAKALGEASFSQILQTNKVATMSFGTAVSTVVGTVIIGAIIMPDITRFMREWKGAIYTSILAYLVVGPIVMGVAGFAAEALETHDLLGIMIAVGLGWAAFAIVIFGSWVLNTLNLYSTTLSVEATFTQIKGAIVVIPLGVLGTVAAFFNILDSFTTFLTVLTIIFVPVAGVIAVDYLLARRDAYHDELEAKMRRLSVTALIAWVAGAVVSVLSSFYSLTITSMSALDAMLVSAFLYGLLNRLGAKD
ncbi:MAG: cytosine permease [Pseudomonadota bacterium]